MLSFKATAALALVLAEGFDLWMAALELPGGHAATRLLSLPNLLIGFANLISFGSLILLLRWFHGVIRDLKAMLPRGAVPFTPGSAVGLFFVPIYSIYHGFALLSTLRNVSDPTQIPILYEEEPQPDAGYREQATRQHVPPAPPQLLIGAWMVFWVLEGSFNVMTKIASAVSPAGQGLPSQVSSLLSLSTTIVSVVGALLSIRVLLALDARVGELHRRTLSLHREEHVEPEKDRRTIAATILSMLLAFSLGVSGLFALSIAGKQDKLGLLWLSLLLLALLLQRVLSPWEVTLRRRWRWGALPLLGALLPSVGVLTFSARTATQETAQIDQSYERLRAKLDSYATQEEESGEQEALALEQQIKDQLRQLEQHTDASSSWDSAYSRCSGQFDAERVLAQIARDRAEALQERAINNEQRFASLESLASAWGRMANANGLDAHDRYIDCLKQHQASPKDIEEREKAREKRNKSTPEFCRIQAQIYRNEIAKLKAEIDEKTDNHTERQELQRRSIQLLRELKAVQRTMYPPKPEVEEESLLDTRKNFSTSIHKLQEKAEALPPAPPGLKRTRYLGPLGFMAAYESERKPKEEQGPALLWVPPSDELESELEQAGRLARKGYMVFLPTVRGTFSNPGNQEQNFGEISDLAAAYEHLAGLRTVRRSRIVLFGIHEGATRALLLAAACEARTVVAAEPEYRFEPEQTGPKLEQREIDLRSPLHFVTELKSPVLLLAGGRVLLEADDYKAHALSENQVRVVDLPPPPVHLETLVDRLGEKLDGLGALTLTTEELKAKEAP